MGGAGRPPSGRPRGPAPRRRRAPRRGAAARGGGARDVGRIRARPGPTHGPAPTEDGGVVMTMVLDEVVGRETRHVLQTYRRQPVTFVRGQGVRLWGADGREDFELLSGIGV